MQTLRLTGGKIQDRARKWARQVRARRFLPGRNHDADLTPHESAVLTVIRNEYTVLPRFNMHQPLDCHLDTKPVDFGPSIVVDDEPLPLPPEYDRFGYPSDNDEYLSWGEFDAGLIRDITRRELGRDRDVVVLDFGCSSGRVLRHFWHDATENGWRLYGVDLQARAIQWMRENFPRDFVVWTGTSVPHLPLADASVDVIYGISIFTHLKFNWDMWLMELERVLRPGGLVIQTFHSETAWQFYYEHRDQEWVRASHSAWMLGHREMPFDYFYFGDLNVSQVFWKRDTARAYWMRYFDSVEVMDPPDFSFQDWLICRKAG